MNDLFVVSNLSEAEAKNICDWKYEGEYSVYNFPTWDEIVARDWSIANENKRRGAYFSVKLNGEFIGFFHIMNRTDHIELGVGMRPDMCGKHYGVAFMRAALQKTADEFPCLPIRLQVLPFNKRAIKCYENVGFVKNGTFICRKVNPPETMISMELADKAIQSL